MVMSVERLDTLEKEVRKTQESVVLLHADLRQMSQAITKMSQSIEKMVEFSIDQRVFKEQCESRHRDLKETDKMFQSRIDDMSVSLDRMGYDHNKVDRLDQILWGIIKWGSLVFGGALISVILYVANHGGIK